ncbi:MAG: PIN domain-containing protein [Chitinophagales bacterium]
MSLYGEIDVYSQGKLKARRLPRGLSARNMGKNDLWISSTASVTGATLLTTDKDFQHLDGIYLTLELLNIGSFA